MYLHGNGLHSLEPNLLYLYTYIYITYIGELPCKIYNINRLKEKNHGIITIKMKRCFPQFPPQIKTFNEIGLNKVYYTDLKIN